MEPRDASCLIGGPYPELPAVLEALTAALTLVLGRRLVGVYGIGSLASGDFDLDSDVDLLVVTSEELQRDTVESLQSHHRQIHAMEVYPAQHLEVSYISRTVLGDAAGVGTVPLWYLDNGSTTFERSVHDNTWVVRWTLRERGIRLQGPPPAMLLGPIPDDALSAEVAATMQLMAEHFARSLSGPLDYWTSRFGQSFAVLTCCRMLHTLRTGSVHSKLASARWATQALDPRWVEVIELAWAERRGVWDGVKITQRADQGMLNRTMDFIHYALGERDQKTDEGQGITDIPVR